MNEALNKKKLFEEALRDAELEDIFEVIEFDDDTYGFRAVQNIKNGRALLLVILDDSLYATGSITFADLDDLGKKEKILRLFNELNAAYKNTKFYITEDNELVIEYHAVSDKDTVVNLTNHSYFNLAGHNSGDILNHKVWINADQFTPTADDLIPTGELRNVEGTPMDFRTLKRIGQDINSEYEPLRQAGGYDHNYVLNIKSKDVEKAAELVDESTGRVMEVFTNKPGLQFYTSNMLTPVENGKDGATYGKWAGVCFETQYFPNACNIKSFPSSILKAGQEYDFVTIYKFSCR